MTFCLFTFAFDCMLCTSFSLFKLLKLRRVLPPQLLHCLIALLSRDLLQANTKVAFTLARIRNDIQRRTLE